MAGEDPGVSTLAVILELIQRAWGAVTGSIKAVVSGTVDIIKTSLFFSWRRKMMQGQTGPDLTYGQQSLRDLRLHEQVGAHIVSVEIGDFKAMNALAEELNRLKVDFAITEHDHRYTLHYKETNEQDVLYAQQMALEKLYGTQDRSEDERETPNDPDQREEHDRDGKENREQNEREDEQHDEHNERQDDERERTDDSSDQDRSNDEQQREDQERESDERQREQQEQEQSEQQTREQSRNQEQVSPAQSADESERASQMEAPQPQHRQENAAALPPNQKFEPLEDLIKEARERARAKNTARNHPERAMRLDHDRSLTRERARNFEPHH